MNKKEVRREVRARVLAINEEVKKQKSLMLSFTLAMHPRVRDAEVVALFSPLPDEPQIGELFSVLSKERKVVLPRVEGDVMRFYSYSPEKMQEGAFGIMEPCGDEAVAPEVIDVILVPGVAFTSKGLRMGRGKGYYDKYMSQQGFRAYKIGVCYDEQMLPMLPVASHDICVDEVLSR